MGIPTDEDMLAELEAMYDSARGKKRGDIQAAIIMAVEVHKSRVIAQTVAPQKFEWPNDG